MCEEEQKLLDLLASIIAEIIVKELDHECHRISKTKHA
jgi:hypothetical protein